MGPYSSTVNQKILFETEDIAKSPNDKRAYRGLVLENGLKVVIVSDSEADKAAAALTVNVGTMSDPQEIPGLAHLCEHMILHGTEQYPGKNEYGNFFKTNSGNQNAFTLTDSTCFHFEVDPDKLEEGLCRMSHLFIKPLFPEEAIESAISAVDSEYNDSKKFDGIRMRQILCASFSKPGHDIGKFRNGSRQSLQTDVEKQGLRIREELLKFYDQHYSSNQMGLCVVGRHSLAVLTQMVGSKFSAIKNKFINTIEWKEQPWAEEQMLHKLTSVPVNNISVLVLCFPLPDLRCYYRTKPGYYFENSVIHMDDILICLFEYLSLIKQNGIQEWRFRELEKLKQISFQFKEKEPPVGCAVTLSQDVLRFPFHELLTWSYRMDQYDPDVLEMLLNHLTPHNMLYLICSKQLEKGSSINYVRQFEKCPDPVRFANLKELFVKDLRNFYIDDAYDQCNSYLSMLLNSKEWSIGEMLFEANGLKLEDLIDFIPYLFSNLHIEALIYGNVVKQEALEMVNNLVSTLKKYGFGNHQFPSQRIRNREIEIPDAGNYVFCQQNKFHSNSAVLVFLQVGEEDVSEVAKLNLLCQIIKGPAFDSLRTEQALGYAVSTTVRCRNGIQGLKIIVQGDKDPDFVEKRIEIFLVDIRDKIEKLTETEFSAHLNSLYLVLLQKPKTLYDMASEFWHEINSEEYNFEREKVEAHEVLQIKKSDLMQFFDFKISIRGPKRKKLCIKVFSTEARNNRAAKQSTEQCKDGIIIKDAKDVQFLDNYLINAAEISDMICFKQSCKMYPRPKSSDLWNLCEWD